MNPKKNFKLVLKIFISILFVFTFQQPVKAQFFKKLAKKAEEKIKREAERRSEKRVDRTIDKSFDKTENKIDNVGKKEKRKNISNNKETSKNNNIQKEQSTNNTTMQGFFGGGNDALNNLPDKLNFSWKYVLKMESKSLKKEYGNSNNVKIIYRVNPNKNLFAGKIIMDENPAQNIVMIINSDIDLNIMLMDMQGMKIARKIPIDNTTGNIDNYQYSIEKIDKKKFLGFACQGYLIKSKDGIAKVYFTENAPIKFSGLFNTPNKPKGLNTKMIKKLNEGLMMHLEYVDNKSKKNNVTMSCLELKKEPYTINLSAYKK